MRPLSALMLAALASGVLTACGIDSGGGKSNTDNQGTSGTRTTANSRLPKPTSGVVTVGGDPNLTFSDAVASDFNGQSDTRLNFQRQGVNQGFRALCSGRADVVETTRLINADELRLCRRNGVNLLADAAKLPIPIQLVSDAIVIATRNESDVGGDCLRKDTVRDIFRSGSPIENWSQVGFDNIRLATTGRIPPSSTFQLFSSTVFNESGSADEGILRSDFRGKRTDIAVRDEITGARRVERFLDRSRRRIDLIRQRSRDERNRVVNRAIARANADALRIIARQNAILKRRKVALRPVDKSRIERNNLRLVVNAKDQAERAAARRFDASVVGVERRRARRGLRRLLRPGVVGYVRFAYYELFENLLRPMEIWDPTAARAALEGQGVATLQSIQATPEAKSVKPGQSFTTPEGRKLTVPSGGALDVERTPICVFPSQRTITNGIYPLAQRTLAYVARDRLKRREVQDYLLFYLRDGQRLAVRRRAIPIDDATRQKEVRLITGQTGNGSTQNQAGSQQNRGTTGNQGQTTTQTTPTPDQTPGSGIPGVDSRGSGGTTRGVLEQNRNPGG